MYADKSKINGVDVADKTVKEKIYQQYLQAYKKGVFNYIKEDINQATKQSMPRKYFSGGLMDLAMARVVSQDEAMAAISVNGTARGGLLKAEVAIDKAMGVQASVGLTIAELQTVLIKRLQSGDPQDILEVLYNGKLLLGIGGRIAKNPENSVTEIIKSLTSVIRGNVQQRRFQYTVDTYDSTRILITDVAMIKDNPSHSAKKDENATLSSWLTSLSPDQMNTIKDILQPQSRLRSLLTSYGSMDNAIVDRYSPYYLKQKDYLRQDIIEFIKGTPGLQNLELVGSGIFEYFVDMGYSSYWGDVEIGFDIDRKSFVIKLYNNKVIKYEISVGDDLKKAKDTYLEVALGKADIDDIRMKAIKDGQELNTPAAAMLVPTGNKLVDDIRRELRYLIERGLDLRSAREAATMFVISRRERGIERKGVDEDRKYRDDRTEAQYNFKRRKVSDLEGMVARSSVRLRELLGQFLGEQDTTGTLDELKRKVANILSNLNYWKSLAINANDIEKLFNEQFKPKAVPNAAMSNSADARREALLREQIRKVISGPPSPARDREEADLVDELRALLDRRNAAGDRAMNGGINLNAKNMHMGVTGQKMDIRFDKAMMAQFEAGDFSGVRPVILGITVLPSVFPLLGLKEPLGREKLAAI